jgi:hypothetical protein
MPARSTPTTRTTLLATALLLGLGSAAHGQSLRAGGSIGVSMTILQPVATQSVRVVGFDVDRNGLATVETTAPMTGPVSHIVMASVSGGANGASVAMPARAGVPVAASPRPSYVVDLGRVARQSATGQPIQLRVQYLTVAGT